MTDPISAAAGAATILDRLSAAVRWVLRRPREEPRLQEPYPHTGFEVRPINFELDLRRRQPAIEINLYAVNYLRTPLTLTELKVTQFHTSGGPLLEQIYLVQEFRISAQRSQIVCCRRVLMDSEIRALLEAQRAEHWSASVAMVARARAGRREYTYGPVVGVVVYGWLYKPAA